MRTDIAKLIFIAVPLIAAAQSGGGQGPTITGPRLGYVFDDSSKSVRVISGIPGAASVDNALAAGTALDGAYISSAGRVAIGHAKDGGLQLLRWPADTITSASLDGSVQQCTRVAFTTSGDGAAILDASAGVVQVWSGLLSSPSLQASYDVSALTGNVVALAVSDDESAAVAGTDAGALMLLGGGRVLASGGQITGAAFLPGTTDLVASDAANNQVLLIRGATGDANISVLADSGQGLQAPSAVAVSGDGRYVVVGNSGAKSMLALDLSGGTTTSVDCQCHANRLDRLGGNAIFRIYDPELDTPLLFDGDSPSVRVAFLPQFSVGGAQ